MWIHKYSSYHNVKYSYQTTSVFWAIHGMHPSLLHQKTLKIPTWKFNKHCFIAVTCCPFCNHENEHGLGWGIHFKFSLSMSYVDTKFSILPPSMTILQHLPWTLHLVLKTCLLYLGSSTIFFSSLRNTLCNNKFSPCSYWRTITSSPIVVASSYCVSCAQASLLPTLWFSRHWDALFPSTPHMYQVIIYLLFLFQIPSLL